RSVFRVAITRITTGRSTSPTSSPISSATRCAGRGGIVLRSLPTLHPAFDGGGSRCDFRERRPFGRHRELSAAADAAKRLRYSPALALPSAGSILTVLAARAVSASAASFFALSPLPG